MKSNKRIRTLFLLSAVFMILFIFSLLQNADLNIEEAHNIDEPLFEMQESPKRSGPGTYFHFNITIDDSGFGGNGTWQELDDNHALKWLNGSGTFEDPYVLENVTLDGRGINSSLVIKNSKKYFIIHNCTIKNSGTGSNKAGIRLINVNNSRIEHTNSSDNLGHGIYLSKSYNNTIINSTFGRNGEDGIALIRSNQNIISFNNISTNLGIYGGLYLSVNSHNNSLLSNHIESNAQAGIYLWTNCDNNTISKNTILNSGDEGILIYTDMFPCNDTVITYNYINNSNSYGIYIGSADPNYPNSGAVIEHNNVSNSQTYDGIYLKYANDSLVHKNAITGNNRYGINSSSRDCLIYHNVFKNNPTHISAISSPNKYNTSLVGNYYDDITDTDNDKDGICDTLDYDTGNGMDYMPIHLNPIHNGSNIEIDVLNKTGYTWKWALTRWWCEGVGTKNNPYALKDLTIDAENIGNGISVQNSRAYYEIENCTIFNSHISGAGLKIENSTNGLITNCDLSNNNGNGIMIDPTNDTMLSFNILRNNGQSGINITDDCHRITIFNNTIDHNSREGIFLEDCYNCSINQNYIADNVGNGMLLNLAHNNTIEWNNITQNEKEGIKLLSSNNNTISNNRIMGNHYNGLNLTNSNHTNIFNDSVFLNKRNGIYLFKCNSTNITKNEMFENTFSGINCSSSNYLNISNNELQDNSQAGIYLKLCESSNISHNIVFSNDMYGIALAAQCKNNKISFNNVSYNGNNMQHAGIILAYACNLNIIESNNVSLNNGNGILFYGDLTNPCRNNSIMYNNISHNLYNGIFLSQSYNNTIKCNNITENLRNGMRIVYSDNNTIMNNQIVLNLQTGLNLSKCNDTDIYSNTLSNNTKNGIYLDGCNFNNISTNIIANNSINGILINPSHNNTIEWNEIYGNAFSGINLTLSENNTLCHNVIKLNEKEGIFLYKSAKNKISFNNISFNTERGLLLYKSDNNTVSNNRFYNNTLQGFENIFSNNTQIDHNLLYNNSNQGLLIVNSEHLRISYNVITQNEFNGMEITMCQNCTMMWNNITQNLKNGLRMILSYNNTIMNNQIVLNLHTGLNLSKCNNTDIYSNTLSNNTKNGIYLDGCNFNNISTNLIANNSINGILINPSHNNTIEWNEIYGNAFSGINQSLSENNTIRHNVIKLNEKEGIFLYKSAKNMISYNNISFNAKRGLGIYKSDDNTILNNRIFNNTNYGLYNYFSNNTLIDDNFIFNNTNFGGIYISDSEKVKVSNNLIIQNQYLGIEIYTSNNCTINNNNISLNVNIGLRPLECIDCNFTHNSITQNYEGILGSGIRLIIYNNSIKYNTRYGLAYNGNYSLIYLNNFTGNGINALDNDTLSSNRWDNGTIGNFWGNYTDLGSRAVDINDDGIGDAEYPIGGSAGANDTRPIFRDANDIPIITLNLPANNSVFSSIFNLNLSSDIGDLDILWYVYGSCKKELDSGVQEQLLSDVWSSMSIGWNVIELHANDTAGNERTSYLRIYKNTQGPTITVIYPSATYWNTLPSIKVQASGPDLHSIWYACNGEQFSLTNDTLAYLNSTVWAELDEGLFYLDIYAKNIYNTQSFTRLTLYKDTVVPVISIELISDNGAYISEPRVKLTVVEIHFTSMYMIFEDITHDLENGTATFLDAEVWKELKDGKYWVAFHAKDMAGNIKSYNYTIYKDTTKPILTKQTIEQGQIVDILDWTDVEITWSIDDLTNLSKLEIRLDDGEWIALDPAALTYTFENVTRGTHNFTLRAYDAAGNMGTLTETFTVEAPEPNEIVLEVFIIIMIGSLIGIAGIIYLYLKKTGIIGE